MPSLLHSAFLVAASLNFANAAAIHKRQDFPTPNQGTTNINLFKGSESFTGQGETVGPYYGTIYVGEPAEGFNVHFDTGSADLQIPTAAFSKSKKGHNPGLTDDQYDSLGQKCEFDYGNPDSITVEKGQVGSSTVTIGGESVTMDFCAVSFDNGTGVPQGLIGLGPAPASALVQQIDGAQSPLQALGWSSYGLYLSSGYTSADGSGVLTVNGTNPEYYEGDFQMEEVPLVDGQYQYWGFDVDNWSINGKTVKEPDDVDTQYGAIVDSGAQEMTLPTPVYNFIQKQLNITWDGFISCEGGADLVIHASSGNTYNIPYAAYASPVYDHDGLCQFMGSDAGPGGLALVGVPFLHAYYTWYAPDTGVGDGSMYMGFAQNCDMADDS